MLNDTMRTKYPNSLVHEQEIRVMPKMLFKHR